MDEKHLLRKRKPMRLAGFDYSQPEAYFVTLATYKRKCIFGRIENDQMFLSTYGRIVQTCWKTLSQKYPFINNDVFVIMPNHLHGILIFESEDNSSQSNFVSLSTVIAFFKSQVTKLIHTLPTSPEKVWQTSFYDHIINSDDDHENAIQYILDNPIQWSVDKENSNFFKLQQACAQRQS